MARRFKKSKTSKESEMSKIYHNFTKNLAGLRVFVGNLEPVVKKHDYELIEKGSSIIKKIFKIMEINENKIKKAKKIKQKPSHKQAKQVLSLLKNLPKLTPGNLELLYKSSFVMLIAYFDFMISDLIHHFYRTYPDSLSDRDPSISLKELKQYTEINEAKDFIINKEIDKILYSGIDDQLRYFEKELKIDCKDQIINWERIKEAIERRNIIVHNNSIINRRYKENINCAEVYEKLDELKIGQRISVRDSYFLSVYDEIHVAATILHQCCWRKWSNEDIKAADIMLIGSMYDALVEDKCYIAEKLGLFSKQCGDVYDEQSRLYLDINYCLSLKGQNKKEALEKEIKKFDISSLSPLYKIAIFALRGDRENFYKNVKKAIMADGDKIKKDDFMEWPLFREFRQDPNYRIRIKKLLN